MTTKNELADIETKLRYLLTQRSEVINQFTEQQKEDLLQTLNIVQELKDQGVRVTELVSQLEYIRDINAFTNIQAKLLSNYNENELGVHYNVYVFGHNGRKNFNECRLKPEIYGSFTDENQKVFETGYLLLQCQPNQMKANKTNELLSTTKNGVNWKVLIHEDNIEINIQQDGNSLLQLYVPFDQIQVSDNIKYAIDEDYVQMKFITNADKVQITGLYINVNVDEEEVAMKNSDIVEMDLDTFNMIMEILPFNITAWNIGFESRSNNEYVTIEQLFAFQKLSKLDIGLYNYFLDSIATDATNNLYGQSTAIAISTLQNQLLDTVRKMKVEYTFDGSAENTIVPNVENLPSFKSRIEDTFLNKPRIIGSSWVLLQAHVYSVTKVIWWAAWKLKVKDYLQFTNYEEISGQVKTDYNIKEWRVTTPKMQIEQILDNGDKQTVESWVETEEISTTFESIRPGNWLICDGVAYDAQIDSMLTRVDNTTVELDGFRVSVNADSEFNPDNKVCRLIAGFETIYVMKQNVVFIIAPTNLATDANPDSITGNINYKKYNVNEDTFEEVNATITFQKVQIEYGSGVRTVYRSVLYTTTLNNKYYSGWGGIVEFQKLDFKPTVYTSRDESDFPTKTSTIPTYKMYREIYWKPEDVLLKTATFAGRNASNTQDKNTSIMRYRAYIPFVDGCTTMIPPFYKPVRVIYGTDWEPAVKTSSMSFETYIQIGPKNYTTYDNPTKWFDETIKFTIGSATGNEATGFWTNTGFEFSPVEKATTYTRIESFYNYSSLSSNVPKPNNGAGYGIIQINEETTKLDLISFSMNVTDLMLPGSLSNQLNIAETVVKLQTAVQLLEYYATYLQTLIENLDYRVTYVEDTLDQIVSVLNSMNSKGPLGKAGSIVSFMGTGVGMFFPLVGLGVSLVAGILSSVDTIQNGDVVSGSVDLVVGGLMASLGFYKWSKRLKLKYGQNEKLSLPDPIKDVPSQPGYTVVDQSPNVLKKRGHYKNGIYSNTNVDYVSQNNQNELRELTLTTRMTKQTPIWAIIDWDDTYHRKGYQSVFMYENSSQARQSSILKSIVEIDLDSDDDMPRESPMSDENVEKVFDVKAAGTDVAQLDFLYSNSYEAACYKIGVDDEIFTILTTCNGYQQFDGDVLTRRKRRTKRRQKKMLHDNNWKIRTDYDVILKSQEIDPVFPITSIDVISRALNPYNQEDDAKLQIIQNILEVYDA